MHVSPAGRAAIRVREGCRLRAYHDSVGVLTIGVGHTGRMSAPPVTADMVITMAEADAMLARDLAPVEEAIARAVKVPLSQNECDALASLAFNIGCGGFVKSTVVARLNKGDRAGAADAFMLWSKPSVLIARRRLERTQFLTPDAPQPAVLPAPSLADRLAPAQPAPAPVPPPVHPGLFARLAFFFGRHPA